MHETRLVKILKKAKINGRSFKKMNWLKFIVICLALILGAWVVFSLIGIVYVLLWYAFILGAIGIAGYIGYQLFKPDAKPKLKGQDTPAQIEFDGTNSDRTLEEYRRKYLNK
jgi:4-hydroxybenzoate polyprenyltransferase